jgi:thiosulfate/3-mercaptopyruvate sulfurtransferase
MPHGPLVSAETLARLLNSDDERRRPTVLDVRWELAAGARRDLYEQGHIPGAAFVDLDRDLSGAPGSGGRHPLPRAADFERALRRAGVQQERPVVVYEDAFSGAAARAWWLLRYFSHPAVAVLDGGLNAWREAGQPLDTGNGRAPARPPGDFTERPGGMAVLDADGAAAVARRGVLLDARAPERYRGESEPIDPVAGHIPGARNRPTQLNVTEAGRLKALALGGPRDLDPLSRLERLHGDRLADEQLADLVTELDDVTVSRRVGLLEVTELGLRDRLLLAGSERELNRLVAVALERADRGHRTRARFEHGHALDATVVEKALRHAELLGEDRGHR